MNKLKLVSMGILCLGSICLGANEISQKETLGQVLFSDKNLSKNRTQSCATCHNPNAGFADDRENGIGKMASLGDDNKSLGDRQAPTASYAKFSPDFHFDEKKQKYIGGQFWDGRAKTLEEQAGGPPLNPIEMGMGSKKEVVDRIKENAYYVQTFKELFGEDIFKDDEKAYDAMTSAIASFERSNEFSSFDSKYDRYLKGEYDLTPLEDLGKSIFFSNNNNSCATCHVLKGEDKAGETFTNYEYHNIGTPANKTLRAKNGVKEIDKGLLANPNVTYSRTASWKEKIGEQSWIGYYNRGFEAWTSYRRLDFPILKSPTAAVNRGILTVPVRYLYPGAEQTKNETNYKKASSDIGGDLMNTKIFWDKF